MLSLVAVVAKHWPMDRLSVFECKQHLPSKCAAELSNLKLVGSKILINRQLLTTKLKGSSCV